jgi:peptide deformylase
MNELLSGSLNLRYWPNPALSEIAEPVAESEFGPELHVTGQMMIQLMSKLKGLGLSGNQVGLLKRIFVMHFPNEHQDLTDPEIICNPELVFPSDKGQFSQEGCLSFPGVYQSVWRHTEVEMSYRTPFGEHKKMILLDLEARIAQHEVNHLDGKMFFDAANMTARYRKQTMKEWQRVGKMHVARSERLLGVA